MEHCKVAYCAYLCFEELLKQFVFCSLFLGDGIVEPIPLNVKTGM